MEISLNGIWEAGINRQYDRQAPVPGLVTDPRQMTEGTLWYRRELSLPEGDWSEATLTLYGARFGPSVYVNGTPVSQAAGGMTITQHRLRHPDLCPGGRVTLEIALQSLADVDPQDASRIPAADLWRSNISSHLWNDVRLRFHGPAHITRLLPFSDLHHDALGLRWEIEQGEAQRGPLALAVQLLDGEGRVVATGRSERISDQGELTVALGGACTPWSPEHPALYRLRALLTAGDREMDRVEFPWGLKEFRVEGLGFCLNDEPVTFRAGTVVWHRWVRDPEARMLAFDPAWFERNIVQRLKSHGANGLRFHLGMPPEALLDLCDRHGLMVQAEWSFFHGMKASRESLLEQWRQWFDLCLRHPSICVIHPWNETEGEELETAFGALSTLTPEYPPLVISHRDVIHIHKYWWSLFENLGLYYDSATEFPQPIIADEFGGNYLDGQGDPGGYPTLRETLLRFLGRGHTRELRLQHHLEANTQVAEYWRRLGAAGFSPFCALGSPEDGNHHFLGPLAEGRPKEVWDGLTAAYAPLSVSLEVWDRNYAPGQSVTLPLVWFNDTGEAQTLSAIVRVVAAAGPQRQERETPLAQRRVSCQVAAHGQARSEVTLTLPDCEGHWRLQALLETPQQGVAHRVLSSWRVRTLHTRVPEALRAIPIGVPTGEPELLAFLRAQSLRTTTADDPAAELVIASAPSWNRLADGDAALLGSLQTALHRGASVVLLDIGPRGFGQWHLGHKYQGPLQGAGRIAQPHDQVVELWDGVRVRFWEAAEPESHLHPADEDDDLWWQLERQATWLWNGLRGGLVVPPSDMEPIGVAPSALLALWAGRGADAQLIPGEHYYAYELAGFYAFANELSEERKSQLRERVRFLVEDAPALQVSINPLAPVQVHDLAALYRASQGGQAERLTPLAVCGKNLSRTPVVQIHFGPGRGTLILSQLITRGRLAEGYGTSGLYGLRVDPAAGQMVLNMLAKARP